MKLLGKRVLLTTPRKKESIIELTPEVERQLEMDMIQEWTNLEVYAVGTDVTTFKPGDKVYVSVSSLSSAERIMIGEDVIQNTSSGHTDIERLKNITIYLIDEALV